MVFFLMHVLSSWEPSDFSTTDNVTTPFWARGRNVIAGQFPKPPRPGSQLPHPTSVTTPLSRVTLGGFYVDQGPICHQFYTCELKTFDSGMSDSGEEEQAVTSTIIKYKNF